MSSVQNNDATRELFESRPIWSALWAMAVPTIASQLILLVYNVADTWYIGRTGNPYMVAASSLVLTVYMMLTAIANMFGAGGGSLMVRLLGGKKEEEARKVASLCFVMAAGTALVFSGACLLFMEPMLRFLGASDFTIGYAKQYLIFVVVIGGLPTVLCSTMSALIRNTGHSKEAGFGMSMGGVLNIILDPIFMFLIMPEGYEVMGAAIATMLSTVISLMYFISVYIKLQETTVLRLPRKIERVSRESVKSIFSVGIPAATGVLLFDVCNMVINRLSSGHGDIELAAIGIILKVERLPLNIGIGICLGVMPLIGYNYAAKNYERMRRFFSASRIAGLTVAAVCVVFYSVGAPYIFSAFISDPETVAMGTEFLRARCVATPFMFLSFNMVYFMQAVNRGKIAFWLPIIRQIFLNIPILILMNALLGMTGIVWTQLIADVLNVAASYIIYFTVVRKIEAGE